MGQDEPFRPIVCVTRRERWLCDRGRICAKFRIYSVMPTRVQLAFMPTWVIGGITIRRCVWGLPSIEICRPNPFASNPPIARLNLRRMMLVTVGDQGMGFFQSMRLHQRLIGHDLSRRPIGHHMTLID